MFDTMISTLRTTEQFLTRTLLIVIVLACFPAVRAVAQQTPPDERLAMYERHVAMKKTSLFKHLKWQFLGPTNTSGRITDVAVVVPKGENYTMYVAGASAGVWRTDNEGTSWDPVFEDGPSTSIGDVTIDPSNPATVWVGTGEANIFRSSMAGAGVFRSTDAGETWQNMGLIGTHTIARIVIDPRNSNNVFVAASGHEWTANEERGVYRTTDGGLTWERVLYVDDMTGAIDLVLDPRNSSVIYAAMWQRIREKWNDPRNEADYEGSGIYKSVDGGSTWEAINTGLPDARYRGRIGLDIARSNPDVLYAFIDNYEKARDPEEGTTDSYGRPRGPVIRGATIFRTSDAGGLWERTSEQNAYMEGLSSTYGWVFGQIRVDPNDENRIYVMGLGLNLSDDAGKTFRHLRGMHGDHHGLWIDPDNSNYLVNINDGGLAVSYDAGEHWRTFTDRMPFVQFFNVSHDMDTPFHVFGSIQDHGSRRGVVDLSHGRQQIPAVDWENTPGGEGSRHAIDPTDPSIVYSAGFYGTISRTDIANDDRVTIMPELDLEGATLRGQWLAPFIISPHNPRIIYHGMNYLFRSMDRGEKWERISPDLTDNNIDRLGDIPYQTIFSIAESPFHFGRLYVGTDDGHLHRTKDSGEHWTELTGHLPKKKWISRIVSSAHQDGLLYLSQNGKRDDDFVPYLFKSTDDGNHWTSIADGIPSGPINVVAEDPKNEHVLYVGTDLGAYVSIDGGVTWNTLADGLPTTFVSDITIHPTEDILVASTHGRGVYALDIRNLQLLTPQVLTDNLHVFPVEHAIVPQGFRSPARPAYIFYFLKQAGPTTVKVSDGNDQVIKLVTATGDAGMNTAIWDLTTEVRDATNAERTGPVRVKPGTYKVTVESGTSSWTRDIVVE